MSTIRCPGGHIFSDTRDPNRNKFYLISDEDRTQLPNKLIEINNTDYDSEVLIYLLALEIGRDGYKCPYCGRLLIFGKEDEILEVYIEQRD